MYRFLLAFSLLLAAFGGSSLTAQQADALFPNEPTLQPGDTVNVMVYGEPELTGSFLVDTQGSLVHPLYRGIQLGGVPFSQLDTVMRDYLKQFREDPLFTIEPRLTIVVTGEVLEGGLLTFGPGTTIAQAVTYAGLSEEARIDQVRLIRDRQVYDVDFEDPEAQWSRVTIRSGDQIIVRERPNFRRDYLDPVLSTLGALSSLINFFLFLF